MIRHLIHAEIDFNKWDDCISRSGVHVPYPYSWYLKITSPGFEALVKDDYQAVLPLTWNKKYGVYYLYQPMFTQQLGVFCKQQFRMEMQTEFLNHIPAKFRLVDIQWHQFHAMATNDFSIKQRNNFILTPDRKEQSIQNNFNSQRLRDLKYAEKMMYSVSDQFSTKQFISDLKNADRFRQMGIKTPHLNVLSTLIDFSLKNQKGKIFYVLDGSQKPLAAMFSVITEKSIVNVSNFYLTGCANSRAQTFLFTEVINNYCHSEMVFDFEGSDIPGIANFYKSFGAVSQSYFRIYANKLPPVFRKLKSKNLN